MNIHQKEQSTIQRTLPAPMRRPQRQDVLRHGLSGQRQNRRKEEIFSQVRVLGIGEKKFYHFERSIDSITLSKYSINRI